MNAVLLLILCAPDLLVFFLNYFPSSRALHERIMKATAPASGDSGRVKAIPASPWWFDFLAALRTPLILCIVLPMSFVYDFIQRIRNTIFFYSGQRPALHKQRVEDIQRAVRAWDQAGRKKRLCTARSAAAGMNTRMPDFKAACNKIDVSGLRDVLEIDEKAMTVTAEPLVDMGYVSRFLVPRQLALQCLPEMDDLTVGGLVNGYGVSTASHRYGTMQDAIVAVEIVLPDGAVVVARADNEHRDLFLSIPWAHGTLGIVVSVTLRLVRVKPYLKMRYIPCFTFEELDNKINALLKGPAEEFPDYLEATLYSPTTAVIQAGYLTERIPNLPVNHISRWYKPWFYKHVEQALFREQVIEELLPLRDYYHRHTKSIYWELEDMIPFANHPVYRWFLGWLGAPKVSLVKATQGVAVRRATLYKHVCQEFMVPLRLLDQLHSLYTSEFHTYPLLLYIIRIYDLSIDDGSKSSLGQGFIRKPEEGDKEKGQPFAYFAELGAYGVPAAVRRQTVWDAHRAIRRCEAFARDVKGYQCLCFDTLQSEQDFETMFDHRLWRSVRQRYGLESAFPTVFAKVKPESGVL